MSDLWKPEEHYGISFARAAELEQTEWPRGNVAFHHLEKLTIDELKALLPHLDKELQYYRTQLKELPKRARTAAKVDRSLNVPHQPLYNYTAEKNTYKNAIDRTLASIDEINSYIKERESK